MPRLTTERPRPAIAVVAGKVHLIAISPRLLASAVARCRHVSALLPWRRRFSPLAREKHASTPELFVGFYKKTSGKGGLTYQEAVLEALCFGWIDGIIKSVDAESYMHRFTPRKPGSIWSNTNVAHVERLRAAGRMAPAGLRAFEQRSAARTGIYSFEQATEAKLTPAFEKQFRAQPRAWAFFQAQPAWYRRRVTHVIVSAKKDETRRRRLARTIAASARGERLQ